MKTFFKSYAKHKLFYTKQLFFSSKEWDVIVIGGGHAGCEAAYGKISLN